MPEYRFDHVHLISPDPLKTAEFYEQMFGAKREKVIELSNKRIRVYLDLNGAKILIHHQKAQPVSGGSSLDPGYGLDHFGLATDDLEAAVAALKPKGAALKEEITGPDQRIRRAWLLAPENVSIELAER